MGYKRGWKLIQHRGEHQDTKQRAHFLSFYFQFSSSSSSFCLLHSGNKFCNCSSSYEELTLLLRRGALLNSNELISSLFTSNCCLI